MSPWLWKYFFAWFILNTQITCSEKAPAQRKEIQQRNAKRLSDTKDASVITSKIQSPTAGLHPSGFCKECVKDTANNLSHSIIYVNQ